MPESLAERLIRSARLLLTVSEEHGRTLLMSTTSEFRGNRRFAHPGLAGDQDHLMPVSGAYPLEDGMEDVELLATPDHPDLGRQRQSSGKLCIFSFAFAWGKWLPADFDGRDRLRNTLEFQFAQGPEPVRCPPAGRVPRQLGREDLAAFGEGAEPCRFDHRVTEVVAVVGRDLTTAQPYAQAEGAARRQVVAVHGLLHGYGARQCGRRGGEDHHEPVPGVLDLAPAVFGYGAT